MKANEQKETIKYIIDCIKNGILPEIPTIKKDEPNFGLQPYIEKK